ncbi:hypothetical protein A3F07_00295 [candidate division WWE3 bacterium RIFCSPHIGHO2_12_FULL_38_15]|uniref:Uncharacterized protein n=1 Tax=candidate division WWE3 bacterium RIFCSPHIGHO2_02_FULL_38_14 TaxID=1802620 RepID=A0A1F4V5Z8_UNCKA|nr:MAG: hypothetical protein A3F07_00295 [candidate division WWE3 bacterium RIFCSPHIGHO2_12_FULL_38_15]OGC52618.1 MAG: hypothetical protein A3D91_01285 [candidate division WWE3 bacterium RIFCSPHIGHO2_02_FULL_38_14]
MKSLQEVKIDLENLYRKCFPNTIHKKILVASTHHPYTSPHIRLISSTYLLNKIQDEYDIKILYWDYTKPNPIKYREELIIDTGILNLNSEPYFLFEPDILYSLQKPILIDFQKIESMIKKILTDLNNLPNFKKIERTRLFVSRLNELLNIYKSLDYNENGTLWSIKLLAKELELTGFKEESEFLLKNSISIFSSEMFKNYLINSLEYLHNTEYNPLKILPKVFEEKPLFLYEENRETHKLYVYDENNLVKSSDGEKINFNELINKIKNTTKECIRPAQTIPGYLFYISNIYEFGKDYDTKNKLSIYFENKPTHLNVVKKDYIESVSFKTGITYSVIDNNTFKRVSSQKSSRLNTINALYLHFGKNIEKTLKDIFSNKSGPLELEMTKDYYL